MLENVKEMFRWRRAGQEVRRAVWCSREIFKGKR